MTITKDDINLSEREKMTQVDKDTNWVSKGLSTTMCKYENIHIYRLERTQTEYDMAYVPESLEIQIEKRIKKQIADELEDIIDNLIRHQHKYALEKAIKLQKTLRGEK